MPGKNCHAFTEEEDHTLKAGYDKYGTVWATILKDPIFQEQNCCSTDLCGHFCNAFPNLYQASGYRPHNSTKKFSTAACTMTNDVTIWTATPSSKSSFLLSYSHGALTYGLSLGLSSFLLLLLIPYDLLVNIYGAHTIHSQLSHMLVFKSMLNKCSTQV
jgi:hypothetical protein